MTNRRIILILTISFAAAFSGFALAAPSQLQVSAHVLPWMQLKPQQHVLFYQVTAADITRGFIDIPAVATITIATNMKKAIDIKAASETGERILLRSGTGTFFAEAVSINTAIYPTGMPITTTFDSRLVLPIGATEGLHSLSLTIFPLI